jgi:mannitol-1-phosphate 5-dehydrogenase
MEEAAAALHAEYPADLSREDLEVHIDDLLDRFRNRALGDTVYRVGRDLNRKLGKNDRLVGAMLLAEKHSLPYAGIVEAVKAGFTFHKTDEEGRLFPGDEEFAQRIFPKGTEHILDEVCGLDAAVPAEAEVRKHLLE